MNSTVKISTGVILAFFGFAFICAGCESAHEHDAQKEVIEVSEPDLAGARAVLEEHLDAVSSKDLSRLEATMGPSNMRLSMPATETTYKTKDFMEFHERWFQDTTWTFETTIERIDAGDLFAHALVQSVYREPLRDGRPYFNRMKISYVLEHENGRWLVVADHASSVEKSTDTIAE